MTGEPITAWEVYQPAFDFRPQAQHVFACNQLPSFQGGMDKGVLRRLLVIPFNRTIPEAERLAHIGQQVVQGEADLLLAWAVDGASRLLSCSLSRGRARFSVPRRRMAQAVWMRRAGDRT